jgi:hypothetical protein
MHRHGPVSALHRSNRSINDVVVLGLTSTNQIKGEAAMTSAVPEFRNLAQSCPTVCSTHFTSTGAVHAQSGTIEMEKHEHESAPKLGSSVW